MGPLSCITNRESICAHLQALSEVFQSFLDEFSGFFVHPVRYDLLQAYLCIIGQYDIVITHADTLSRPRDERESVVMAFVEHFPFGEDSLGLRVVVKFPYHW